MRLGLRLQLLLAIGSLLVLALVPLYIATTQLTQATMAAARESSARALGRATAAHVLAASTWATAESTLSILEAQVGAGGVDAIALYEADGSRSAAAGDEAAQAELPETLSEPAERSVAIQSGGRPALMVMVPATGERGGGAVTVVSLATDPVRGAGALPRIVGLYTGIVALALLVFAYIAMTRMVVRPVVGLSDAARRVASGARTLDVPRAGAAELVDLASSVAAMTDRLRADEEVVRRQVVELEAKNREIVRTQEHLVRSERLASVGRLAAGMAHEIGNPIAAILGLQEVVLAGGLSPAEERDLVERMRKETERIHRVLRDLLDFARPDAPGSERAPGGSAAQAIDDVVALVAPQKELRNVDVTREVAAGLPAVAILEARLTQVLLNLVMNAASAVKKPGGRVTIRAALVEDQDQVRIEVEDDGPGIDPSIRARLFEPFATTKPPGEGTGLGLAVCRGLVEAAGGTIGVEDPEGGGARFVVTLPRSAAVTT